METPQPSIHAKPLQLYFNAALTSTKVEVATGKRHIHGWYIENTNDVTVYAHFYDAASADVTVGTTAPTFSVPIPAGGYADKFTDFVLKRLGTGFVMAITTDKTGVAGVNTPTTACLTGVHYL